MNLKYMEVSLFEISYKKKLTFSPVSDAPVYKQQLQSEWGGDKPLKGKMNGTAT